MTSKGNRQGAKGKTWSITVCYRRVEGGWLEAYVRHGRFRSSLARFDRLEEALGYYVSNALTTAGDRVVVDIKRLPL